MARSLAKVFLTPILVAASVAKCLAADFTFEWDQAQNLVGVNLSTISESPDAIPNNLDHYYGPVLMDWWTEEGRVYPPLPGQASGGFSHAEWNVAGLPTRPPRGNYCVYVRYASLQSRPLSLRINDITVLDKQLKGTTKGWTYGYQQTFLMGGPIPIDENVKIIALWADSAANESWPHFSSMTLRPNTAGTCAPPSSSIPTP